MGGGVGVGWAENTACYVLLLDPGKEKRTLYSFAQIGESLW